MKDLEIILENRPGTLALLGETLGKHHISLEGGGVFNTGDNSIAHFLVNDAETAEKILMKAGFTVVSTNEVLIQKLRQDVPGQLGMFCRELANAGINILTQYSDHSNQLILVVDDFKKANEISAKWMREWWP
jgi:hypothetical protein